MTTNRNRLDTNLCKSTSWYEYLTYQSMQSTSRTWRRSWRVLYAVFLEDRTWPCNAFLKDYEEGCIVNEFILLFVKSLIAILLNLLKMLALSLNPMLLAMCKWKKEVQQTFVKQIDILNSFERFIRLLPVLKSYLEPHLEPRLLVLS